MLRIALSLFSLVACAADDPRPAATANLAAVHAEEPPLTRVAVIGASVSFGHHLKIDLARTFQATLAHDGPKLSSQARREFFMSPMKFGDDEVEAALEERPTLVVAVDFLFWFGYGTVAADGGPMHSEDDRLALLEKGLKLVESFQCPVVVGDFADMSASVGHLLLAAQMPKAQTLERLNHRVHEWASTRPSVVLLPLGDFVGRMRGGLPVRIGEREFAPAETNRWLQRDRLHTTDEGLVALAMLVERALIDHHLAAPTDFLDDPKLALERVREREAPQPAAKH